MTDTYRTRLARSFDSVSYAYERGRPTYAPEAVARVVETFDLGPASRVLDLAAGTGKLTRQLVVTGATVVAVEPLSEMRARLTEAVPGVEVLAGTAEAIPLPDASIDLVTVGQGFHWFDVPAAAAEIQRVLEPAGGLALLWNTRADKAPWDAQESAVLDAYGRAEQREHYWDWREPLATTGLFSELEEHIVTHEVVTDIDGALADALSHSYIAALDEKLRAEVLDRLTEVYQRHAGGDGRLVQPFDTHVYTGRALPDPATARGG